MATALILAATGLPTLRAQAQPVITLDEMVVSAQRSSQQINQTPSAITLVPLEELDTTGITSLQTALGQQPGTVIVNSGATGAQSSVFMRGASSHQTLFMVDGVRMNDRSAPYPMFWDQPT